MHKPLTLTLLGLTVALPMRAQVHSWQRTEHTLALLRGTNVVWKAVADPAQGKPYFHPLATSGGTLLSDLRPQDHPWHLALWFSWKFINGLNYWDWEKDRATQRYEGATELTGCTMHPHKDHSASLSFDLAYHPWNEPAVMTEKRTVDISAPADGSYELLWTAQFTAVTNVLLSRTPPPGEPDGKAWGGYAGLSLRCDPATRNWTFTSSEGTSGEKALHGKAAAWVKFSAGTNGPAVVIFDDPHNPRYPTPWFIVPSMPYFSPAILFKETIQLKARERLTVRYRILVSDGTPGRPAVSSEQTDHE
jgi:hypothetical protein